MGKISGSHCLVLGCRNRQLLNQTNTRSYFRFPRDADLCKKWVDFCNRPELYLKYDENGPEYLYKSSRICSDHFQPTDFNNPNLFSQGLKKGSVPTVNPASKETKPTGGGGGGGAGGGGGGGSGSSNGAGSPIDDKLLSAVASSMPNLHPNLSLIVAAAVAAAAQSQSNAAAAAAAAGGLLSAGAKRTSDMLGAAIASATSPPTSSSSSSTSSKRNRAVPPLAAPTGALANLIQRQQQIKEQQVKEQQIKDLQRKAAAIAAGGLVNGQVSITPAIIGTTTTGSSSPNGSLHSHSHSHGHHSPPNNNGGAISLVTTKKGSNHHHNNNNNNNNVSNHNHNHQHGGGAGKLSHRMRDEHNGGGGSEYGINMIDMDMTGGESSEGDSSYQNSADEDYAYRQKLKVAKVEAVIPPSLKSQLTVTPASVTAGSSPGTTINNNSIHNVNANGGGLLELNVDYKEKFEQTLKELFACRKIVKNQNKAIKQQQVEIDFLNQLLKEK